MVVLWMQADYKFSHGMPDKAAVAAALTLRLSTLLVYVQTWTVREVPAETIIQIFSAGTAFFGPCDLLTVQN